MKVLWAALALVAQATAPARWEQPPTQGGLLTGSVERDVVALRLRVPGAPDQPAALADGRFLLGLDRDAVPAAELVATLADGREVATPLAVAPRVWPIERVDAPYHPPRFDERRPPELARIAAARASDTGERGWTEPLRWPIAGPIRGLFGAQRVYRGTPGSYHGGIDIAAPTGAVVRAPAAGRVVLATVAPFTLEGNLIIIDHGGGLSSALIHLSRIDVAEGQAVAAGEPVGAVGATGRATGPHLHWGLTWRTARLDPLLAAGPPPRRADDQPSSVFRP